VPVLATKLTPPATRRSVVSRARLLRALDATLEPAHRLTLVSAPAGFGKTTVVAGWCAPHTVAWVSVDAEDDSLPRLLAHVTAALVGAGLPVEPTTLDPLPDQESRDEALAALVNDAARACATDPDQLWVLVLDDYHAISHPDTHAAVSFLLEHLPTQLRLLLTTRADPPLPLSRLRSRGQLAELRAADLRFTVEEAQQFLTDVMDLRLGADAVAALEQRTEGWAVGLQLAGLSLRDRADAQQVDEFVADFTGSHRFVLDYLVDEVLTRQPPDVREFLLHTSVLQGLTGELCDVVTGGTDGARTLEALERSNLFVVPLDAQRTWYRYHHLFADVLAARLAAEGSDEVPELHRRASDWYAARGRWEDAVRHALAGGDHDRAGHLVETGLAEARRARRDDVLLGWIAALPDSVVRRNPVLSTVAAWAQLMSGRLDAADAYLDTAEGLLDVARDDPALRVAWADTEDLRMADGMVALYRASLAQARGDVDGTMRRAREALDLAGPEDHMVRGGAAGFLGLALWAAGDVRPALTTFTGAVESLHAAGNLVDELDATIVLADMWLARGRPSRARALYEEALQSATADGPPYPRAASDLHVGLAELARESGDLAGAQAHLDTARVLAERAAITENRHRWYVAAAQLRSSLGEHDAALELLEQAQAKYRPGFYPDLRPIPSLRARVHVEAGNLDAAQAWADDVTTDPGYLHEHAQLTVARLVLARHREARDRDAAAALSASLVRLVRLGEVAATDGRAAGVLEAGLLQALTEQALGEPDRARDTLAETLGEAPERDHYTRLFLDEGAPLVTLLQGAGPDDAVVRALADRLLHQPAAPEADAASSQRPAGLIDPLSERELEVLRHLAGERTGPELARDLFISLNTLRTHTKRIFTKLDVSTRAAAVRRGRELGLV
jgi:LuxR family maltose regulon positive regulatory protein